MSSTSGYGDNIEGIPLPGSNDIPQVKGSAAPNRDEPPDAFNAEGGEDIVYPVDYFDAEKEELGGPNAPFIANKEPGQATAGLEDEENDYGLDSFVAQDAEQTSDAEFPETQPLHVEDTLQEQSPDQFDEVVLEPDNIQYGSE